MCGLSLASAGAHTKSAFEAASPLRGPGAAAWKVLCGTASGRGFWRAALQPALRTNNWTWTPKAQRAASATALPQCPSWGSACQLLAPAKQPGQYTRERRGAPNVDHLPGPIRTRVPLSRSAKSWAPIPGQDCIPMPLSPHLSDI